MLDCLNLVLCLHMHIIFLFLFSAALFFTTGFYTGFDLTSARNFIMEPRNRYDAIVTVALNRNPDNIPRDR